MLRKPQNFAKSLPIICPMYCQSVFSNMYLPVKVVFFSEGKWQNFPICQNDIHVNQKLFLFFFRVHVINETFCIHLTKKSAYCEL